MANNRSPSFFLTLLFHLLTISASFVQISSLGFGINYGQIANNLPSPSRVVLLIKSMNVTRIKLYDADPNVLLAFSNSNVQFVVGLGNEYLANMTNPSKAQSWIQQHLQPYLSQTKITCITVGNEVFNTNDTQLIMNLLPAMQSVHGALVNLGLDQQVTVTTAHSFNILSNSYPPSSGSFRQDLLQYIQPLLAFHSQFNSPFLINAYPFFAYKDNPSEVSLSYVLFEPNPGSIDPNTNLNYDNMLYAQIDAVYAAIKMLGHTDIEVRISKTGWPSKGDTNEIGVSPENAATYNGNLLKRIEQKQGAGGDEEDDLRRNQQQQFKAQAMKRMILAFRVLMGPGTRLGTKFRFATSASHCWLQRGIGGARSSLRLLTWRRKELQDNYGSRS
ncbi:glucan endo-1,3-beta-glucosidase 14-like [Arachis ipaensis]|uniref:glucan endo-1,3-beta-glucosidase 14-like n=1 Tax=Arachis ipaensis TaxID=130454 RepID=UPI0007AFCB31|nr:glucan endo-1,3-beta-glucosidase 14-like [Arachis ipaensis]